MTFYYGSFSDAIHNLRFSEMVFFYIVPNYDYSNVLKYQGTSTSQCYFKGEFEKDPTYPNDAFAGSGELIYYYITLNPDDTEITGGFYLKVRVLEPLIDYEFD